MSHKTFCDSNFQLHDPQKSLCLFQEPKDRDQAGSIYCYQVMVGGKQLHRPTRVRASLWPWCRYGVPFNRLTGMKEHSSLRPGGGRQGQRQGFGRNHQSRTGQRPPAGTCDHFTAFAGWLLHMGEEVDIQSLRRGS